MIEMQTLFIIVLFFCILNNIKTKKTRKIIKISSEKESFNIPQNMKFGQIQYDVVNYDNNDLQYKYQNFDIIKKDKTLELSENINVLNKYNDLTKLNNNFKPSHKNTVTNLPCQQDIIYDTRFFQPSDADTYNPSDLTTINYKERKIQDVYNEIVNGDKTTNKKQLSETTEFKTGASNLKTYTNIDWEYEGEDDGMSYDPRMSNLSAF